MFIVCSRRQLQIKAAVLLGVLALALAARLEVGHLNVGPAGGSLRPIERVDTLLPRVALTFDLTWGHRQIEAILSVLAEQQVRATFFVSDAWLAGYPDLAQRLVRDGHELATLGRRITDLRQVPTGELRTGLAQTQSLMERTVGRRPRFFRPPEGLYNDAVIETATQSGLATVTWSLDARDATARQPREIVRRVLGRVRKGDVVLLTAADYSRHTAAALPDLLRGLSERGLAPVTLSELLPAQ